MNQQETEALAKRVREDVLAPMKRAFVGKDEIIDLLAVSLTARENLFLHGPPGTAKSALVHAMAKRIDGKTFDYFEVTDVEIVGDLVIGNKVTITGKSTIKQPFTITGAHVTASISGVTIFKGIVRPDEPLSFKVGPAQYSLTRPAPFTPFKGNYKMIAKALGVGDVEFECYIVTATVQ